jgi:hypothetical protein
MKINVYRPDDIALDDIVKASISNKRLTIVSLCCTLWL